MTWTEKSICDVLVRRGQAFCCRRMLCVANVSFGFGLDHEADLIAVTGSGYAYEVEIKISSYDLRKDAEKGKWRRGLDPRIKRFYYAVPEELVDDALKTDERFGVVKVFRHDAGSDLAYTGVVRRAKDLPGHRAVTAEEVQTLHRLNSLRYWDLRLQTP
jgi:hypothetical protein